MDGPYGSSQVSFVAAQRQTLAEPPKAIHFQDIQLQHGLPAARRGSVLSKSPRLPLGPRKCGCNIGATVPGPGGWSLCAQE